MVGRCVDPLFILFFLLAVVCVVVRALTENKIVQRTEQMGRQEQAIQEERAQHREHSFAFGRVKDDLKSWAPWCENNDHAKAEEDRSAENVKAEGRLPAEGFSVGPQWLD